MGDNNQSLLQGATSPVDENIRFDQVQESRNRFYSCNDGFVIACRMSGSGGCRARGYPRAEYWFLDEVVWHPANPK